MKNLFFKTAMWKGGGTTVNRQSTDGQVQRRYSLTPISKRWKALVALLFLFTFAIGNVWGVNDTITMTGLTAHNSDKAVSEYFSASSTLSVGTDKELTSLTSGVDITSGYVWNTNGSNNTTLNSVSYACGQIYQNKSGKKWSDANPVFYAQFVIPTGATFTLSKINYAFGTKSAAFTTVIEIYNQTTSSAVYTSSTINISSGGTAESNITGLTNVLNSGTYRIKVSPATTSTSTGKYWGMGKLEVIGEYSAASSTNYTISYNANGGSGTMENTTNTVAACGFTAPTGKAFAGWKDAENNDYEVGASVDGDVELYAQWADAYSVTYTVGAGSGTAPAAAQYAEGVKFNLPGQGSMTAPAGKAFDGWKANGTGDKLAANAEYTMGNAEVEFVAQWKAVPQTIYYWQSSYSGNPSMNSAVNVTGGTIEWKTDDNNKSWANESYNKGSNVVPADLQVASGKKAVKSGGNALYAELTLAGTATFQEGDTIYVGGYKKWMFSTTKQRYDGTSPSDDPTKPMSGDIALVTTGSSNNSYDDGYAVIPAGVNVSTMYLIRGEGATSSIAAIKVVRPAQKDVKSTTYDLTAVKINGTAISAADLATLKTGEAYLLDLATEYPVGPTVKFARKTTITYEDDSQKVTNDTITVTASEVSSKWQAQATIGTITYTVKMAKVSAAKVYYYDGSTKLGEETVAINGNPAEYADYQSKDLSSFVGWYDNSGLTGDAVTIASATITKDTTFYGKWNPVYATSINIEQWVLDNGAGKGATTKTSALLAEMETKNYLSNIAWENKNNELDTLDDSKTDGKRNYAYLGLKVKKNASNVRLLLQDGKSLKVKFGYVAATPNIKIGDAAATQMTITEGVYSLDAASGDREITISTTSADAVVFKQIMIDEEIQNVILPAIVTLDANDGTYTDESVKYTGTALVIGDATPASDDYLFEGWYDGETKINASAYIPTANVTLVANYTKKKYTITYVGGEGATSSMDADEAEWGEDYTALACGFEKENHSFSKWIVEGVTGITEIAAGSAFVMPKGNVTLTAQWVNEALVARIGENYYGSLPEAVAAAIASEETTVEIQLLAKASGEITGCGVKIPTANKTIIIDFNGMKYIAGDPAVGSLGTETLGFQLLKDNNITLKNGILSCQEGSGVKMLINNYSNLTLENMKLDGSNLNIAASGAYTLSNNNGNVVIGNGAEIVAKEGGIAFDVCYYASYPSVSVTVLPGASIDGKIEMSMSNNKQGVEENCQLIITGGEFENFSIDHTNIPEAKVNAAISAGTFDAKVENLYCAENFVPSEADPVTGKYTVEPKDAASLIKAVATATSQDITGEKLTGIYKGAAHISASGSYKFNQGNYFMVQLKDGENFQAGDIVKINVASVNDCNGFTIYSADEFTSANLIIDTHENSDAKAKVSTGINEVELPNTYAGSNKLYVARCGDCDKYLNAGIDQVEVTRVVYPELTAITINGEACVKGTGNAYTITLPEEGTDFAALTVVPTVIRNAPHATTPEAVISNEGAWAEGANTYRVMDKDGDYTDYTITITLIGQAEEPNITADPETPQAYCAGSEPTLSVTVDEPTDGGTLSYAWFKVVANADDEQVGSSATYTVADAGTYYVVVTNTVEGKLAASATSENAVITKNVAAAITTQPTGHTDVVSGTEITLSVVATNATGYQWYICDDANKTNASAIENAENANYVFNCTANAYYYCVVGSACGDDITSNVVSVKLEPEGCNTFASKPAAAPYNYEQTGEWTFYNVDSNGADKSTENVFTDGKNFDDEDVVVANTRRFALKFEKDVESVTLYGVGGNDKSFTKVSVSDEMVKNTYTELTATATKTDLTSQQHIYTIEDMIIPAGKYAWFELSGSLKFFKICYTAAPEKCEAPVLPTLANQELCEGDAIAAWNATTTVSDGGELSYQWYNADSEEAIEDADEATFTPSADGNYYVIVTNTLAGYRDNSTKSATLKVEHFAAAAITEELVNMRGAKDAVVQLAVTATGKNLHYAWKESATIDGTYTAVDGAADAASLNVTITEGMSKYYKVVVSSDCGADLESVAKVEQFVPVVQANVIASTIWDWEKAASVNEIKLTTSTTPKRNEGFVMANGAATIYNNANFESDKLYLEGEYIVRKQSNKKLFQGQTIKFNAEKAGVVRVSFSNTDTNPARELYINGTGTGLTSASATAVSTGLIDVPAGEVSITAYLADKSEDASQKYVRVYKVEYYTIVDRRTESWIVPGELGTVCLKEESFAEGATIYELQGIDGGKLVFDALAEGETMQAGKPYLFEAAAVGQISFYGAVNGETTDVAGNWKGMYGTFDPITFTPDDANIYYFSGTHIWAMSKRSKNITVGAYRCYVKMDEVRENPVNQGAQAGRRRVTLGVQGGQVATGIENAETIQEGVQKIMIDGQLFILRGEKMYDATGRLVK